MLRAWIGARSRSRALLQQCRRLSAPPPQIVDPADGSPPPPPPSPPPPAVIDSEETRRAKQRAADLKAIYEGRMDFEIATRVAFGESKNPNPKELGLDWHLWQFFVCVVVPVSLIYMVAMYARREIRRLEKERGIEPLPKKTWANRYEIDRLQKEYQAKRTVRRAGLDVEELKSLKGRLDSIDDKLAKLETFLNRPALPEIPSSPPANQSK
ncbi:uncharacterized protein LOC112350998 [Selaginella moellendorffii]|uniref:uncharacterized protein LOC112350998 n=1 Tax=Selaginella moellendorffii TaxID=88036 RepID=UPI000D1CCB88|nr:uncharacterized protein LOC112350998 [Selaginella moellendorffii]|eukprot:XP_024543860.1 uncharacterized protein LOC112350998 [Selaginella moellendorffii]